ncbi:Dyp-type peroxidase [Solirubrobacter sp. CPCC 204708]|uniref:Dyp-type peroxidase n=1 Tax=Solirubrobacter deserti TaxID=2282478 RepID=A0ABT4RS61_9ACTN|nr:Dyp-type peroxidase [Solirubrobacter deserti]MBE2317596.1 Dyp-type peroxidase [Solirubrobacter deserti]MDA0141290.1 Dyp-type peroxidase [Solirubrobacter deserti]
MQRRWGKGVPIAQRGPGWTYRPDDAPPSVYGPHQPGIVTPHLTHALLTAYDLDGADPREVLEHWTKEAETRHAQGQTVTLGLGPAVLPSPRLKPLPHFHGDALDPRRCGGDLAVLIQADDPPEPLEGLRPRWQRRGARRGRGALGFHDGTLNLKRPRDFDRHVWVTGNDHTGMVGGTYLVVRDIHVQPTWHTLKDGEQEQIIGRDKRTGAPLTGTRLFDAPILDQLPPDAHIRVAAPRTAHVAILRRGYDTPEGLLFLAFMADPRRQFTPLMQRLAEHDALHAHTQHRGSAIFAIPPGAQRNSFIAQPLLD